MTGVPLRVDVAYMATPKGDITRKFSREFAGIKPLRTAPEASDGQILSRIRELDGLCPSADSLLHA